MTDKTKNKIEAMFPFDINDYNSEYKKCQKQKRRAVTPWAEWCQRFEVDLNRCLFLLKQNKENDSQTYMIAEMHLKEYRQWLKEL